MRAGFTGENRARRDEHVCELSRSGFGTHRILYGPRVRVHVARRGEAHKASCILQHGQKDGQGGSKQPPADPRPQERPHEERRREEETPRDVGGDPTRPGFTPAPHPAPHGCVHVSLKKGRETRLSVCTFEGLLELFVGHRSGARGGRREPRLGVRRRAMSSTWNKLVNLVIRPPRAQ